MSSYISFAGLHVPHVSMRNILQSLVLCIFFLSCSSDYSAAALSVPLHPSTVPQRAAILTPRSWEGIPAATSPRGDWTIILRECAMFTTHSLDNAIDTVSPYPPNQPSFPCLNDSNHSSTPSSSPFSCESLNTWTTPSRLEKPNRQRVSRTWRDPCDWCSAAWKVISRRALGRRSSSSLSGSSGG